MDAIWYRQKDIYHWCDFVSVFETHLNCGQWVFRGQGDAGWSLTTPLERQYLKEMVGPAQLCGKEPTDKEMNAAALAKPDPQNPRQSLISRLERGLLREFQRRAHHFSEEPTPELEDTLEWLALMRHYDAPTRLLDWTYSFFVAAFFALVDSTGDSAIWAVDTEALQKPCEVAIARHPVIESHYRADPHVTKLATFRTLFLDAQPPLTMVGAVTPRRLNRRLTIQQGTFLCPGNITVPFEDNFKAIVDLSNSQLRPMKYVLRFSLEERQRALLRLLRMNISWATLFPDLAACRRVPTVRQAEV
jgi:hypothetical protein